MNQSFEHDTFLSPFTWRYGSAEMREIWSQVHIRRIWRRIWVALAQAQQRVGLVSQEQLDDLKSHVEEIDIERAHALEAELMHDLMAEVHAFAEQCPVGGGIIHLGATSMDIEDNADAIRLREALDVLAGKMERVLRRLAELIDEEADAVCMAFTHLQPAEPTTIGYRLAFVAQDLLADYDALKRIYGAVKGKGFKGAVGTSASYFELLAGTEITPRALEADIMSTLGLDAYEVTHQTYPRRQDWDILNVLAGIAMTVHKFAFDVRLLQSPPFGEWGEPFGKRQIGSSAMPFKRNPIHSENMNSLARYVAALPRIAWDNAANHLLERTLDDSGNRRIFFPEAFLAVDELLSRMSRLIDGLRIDRFAIQRNLETYGVFAATERVLMEAVRGGGDRQILHEVIREHSMTAWDALRQGQENPLALLLAQDPRIIRYIPQERVPDLLRADQHVGDAPERARKIALMIRETLG